MLLFGAMFKCLDPILTIAACLSFKSPFVVPLVGCPTSSCFINFCAFACCDLSNKSHAINTFIHGGSLQRSYRSRRHKDKPHGWDLLCAGVKRNFWLANFLTSRHVLMRRVIFYIPNTLRIVIIRAEGFVFRWGCRFRVRRRKIIEVKD